MPYRPKCLYYAPALLLCACTSLNGVPNGEPNFDVGVLLAPDAQIGLQQKPQIVMDRPLVCKVAYGTAPPPSGTTFDAATMQFYRNQCVEELMSMVDVQYEEYKKSLRQTVDDGELFADLAVLGLGTAGALVPGKTTKSILSGTAAAVTGAKTAISADVLYNASVLVLINQMDTDRRNQQCVIQTELKYPLPPLQATSPTKLTLTSVTTVTAANTPAPTKKTTQSIDVSVPQNYDLAAASRDLIEYYYAGTLTHALQALQAKSGNQAVAAKQQVKNQKTGSKSVTTTATADASSPSGAATTTTDTSSPANTGACSAGS